MILPESSNQGERRALSPPRQSRKLRAHMTEPGTGGELRNSVYRRTTRSRRRMTAARQLAYRMLVPLGVGLIRFWWSLCRVRRIEGAEHLAAALAQAPSLGPCYWHQHQRE